MTLEHHSQAGADGYPGNLTARVTYALLDSNEVSIEYSATTDAPTVVNLVNHAYFNLAGKVRMQSVCCNTHSLTSRSHHTQGTIHDHVLTINGDSYLPLDEALIPFGESGCSPN